jgi:hypothetical protein
MLRISAAAFLALLSAAPALAYEPHPYDTYLGQRAYPDPFIWDGWKVSRGYLGRAYYGKSWYLLRRQGSRVVYVHRPWQVSLKDDKAALSRGP